MQNELIEWRRERDEREEREEAQNKLLSEYYADQPIIAGCYALYPLTHEEKKKLVDDWLKEKERRIELVEEWGRKLDRELNKEREEGKKNGGKKSGMKSKDSWR
ncbi:hypothetical protein AGMMS50222_07000 [Endomicrobiia bacterium]|nr:hypothetical protein AGMMS49556_06470 [Endomicrobiia bacterium]GHT75643.1 hypothetical protein AGMMS50222_07000 [Endomicrobiia bacterium]